VAVHVVLEIKHARETSAGRLVLRPRAVRVLRAGQEFDAAADAGAVGVTERAQTHHRPGGLRGGAWTLAFENRIVVSVAALAPATVGMLDTFQPIAGFKQPRLLHVEVQGAQPAQNLPRAVDVVDA